MLKTAIKTRAYATTGANEPLIPFEIERRAPRADDVLIDIKYCGVCHSDIHNTRDEWGGALYPMVPGHEIVGIVTEVGSAVTRFKPGDRVGVGCMVDTCKECSACNQGLEQYCQKQVVLTYSSLELDGVTRTYGGYSRQITVRDRFVVKIPDSLPLEKAAPLLCAGITTYSPLRHWQAGPGKSVAVVGLGGLGHVAVRLAVAMGAKVTVVSRSLNKKADAAAMGAVDYIATSIDEDRARGQEAFDLIINTVSSSADMDSYLGMLKLNGTMVLVGAPPEPLSVNPFGLLMRRRALAGSTIGGMPETQEMLDFCGEHGVTAEVEVIKMQDINQAYERLLKADVRYRFVIDMASL
ncbi:MAG: NAD(P)-dependent alcohol dehydrogenase [Candidatus Obscuribacter phosphatis]|uniref:NAD(P)-dependent alcohol dehydrogenase n=1 Tax=Candidatus Obscuribacter phosphatis TaxID=1906157 RepID=A0A8J7TM77_9BACT|nr:NAD(P)-dependent alcohol dehydrogenase [Candidatus Obscuribacter phosphatis]